MNHLLSLLLLFTLTSTHAQRSKLTGTWKTVAVDAEGITIDRTKADSVSVSDEFKRINTTAIGSQNKIAGVRMMYSHNHFVFGKDAAFNIT